LAAVVGGNGSSDRVERLGFGKGQTNAIAAYPPFVGSLLAAVLVFDPAESPFVTAR
jgi:hypothetical protein